MTPQLLIDHAERYLLGRETTTVYARQIRSRCAEFARFLGDVEVSADALNRFLVFIADGRRSSTVRGYRTAILSVLRDAGWTPETRVRSVRVFLDAVECFNLDEITAQLHAADKMKGMLPNGMTNAMFWRLAILGGYSLGVRQADLLAIRRMDVGLDGTVTLQPSKTRRFSKVHTVRFCPQAVQLIYKHNHEYAVPWPHSQETFRQEYKALLIAAGVRRGCWKWLRRSAGTFAEMARAGNGHRLLGNSQRTFDRHYNAVNHIDPRPISPPPLQLPWWRKWLPNWGA